MDPIAKSIENLKKGFVDEADRLGFHESEVPGGLGPFRDEAIAALTNALSHANQKMRFEAAWALGCFRTRAANAVPSLVKLLKDPITEVRAQAAETLGLIGMTAQFVPEVTLALGSDNAIIRQCAAEALAHLGPEARDAVPALTAALADSDKFVRSNAATTLGAIGADAAAAVPALFQLVLSEDSETQITIVEALVSICHKSASAPPILRALLEAPGVQVRGSAAMALRKAAQINAGA